MRIHERTWRFRLQATPEACWPLLSDSVRYNEAMGVPRHRVEELAREDGTVRFFGEAQAGPLTLRWEELPVNWVREHWYEHVRRFHRGPLQRLGATLRLAPAAQGTEVVFRLAAVPRGLAGPMLCRPLLREAGRRFAQVVAAVARHLDDRRSHPFAYRPPRPSAAVRARLARLVERLGDDRYAHGLAPRIARHLLDAQETDLMSIRPIALARDWGIDERETIEAFLAAARAGLLGSRWDLLCPRCRMAKHSVEALEHLPDAAHCATCNTDYQRDYARNVELSFFPAPALRAVPRAVFCWLGPTMTPHIAMQITLEPGEQRRLEGVLGAGEYRVRTMAVGSAQDLAWRGGALPGITVGADSLRVEATPPGGAALLCNTDRRRRTLVVEHREWLRDALTAHRVSTLQAFRDLFSDQVLRPGDDVAVDHVTFMFTDFKDSTALYERLGDAGAYHAMRSHFALLTEQIREHAGAVVKTLGDGVHAAFADPADAVAAALDIQHAAAGAALRLRIGMHSGASLAVTINDRLDYYGSTVNLSARLEGLGNGGDLVMSRAVAEDPGVRALLEGEQPTPGRAKLKGFAAEQDYLSLTEAQVAALGRRRAHARDAAGRPEGAAGNRADQPAR